MRKNILIIFAAVLTLLSCSNSLQPPAEIKLNKAYVSFALNETVGRTALPSTLDKEDLSYELAYQKKNTEVLSLRKWNNYQDMEKSFADKIELECGNWVFILTAKNNSKAAYISSVEKEVKPGENSILFSFKEVENGTGAFSVTANLSIGKSEKVTAALFDIENKPVEGFDEEVLELKKLENKVTAVYEKEDVPCGYYIVKFFVYRYADDSEYEVAKSEMVRVASGNISVGEVYIDNNWNKSITLFTGTVDCTEEDDGDTIADIPMELLKNNPDAYITAEVDYGNGVQQLMLGLEIDDTLKSVWQDAWKTDLEPGTKTYGFKCSDILNMLSDEDLLLDNILIIECGGLKIIEAKLTYETVAVLYDGEGVDLGKTSERLPVGMKLLAPEKHKEQYLFDYWRNAAGERIDNVPEDDITLYPVWKKSEVLFTGSKDRVGETGGSDKACLSVETLKYYPDAYLLIEDDVNTGNRMIEMINSTWDHNFYTEEWTVGHTGIELQEFKCSDILEMMTEEDRKGTNFQICDWGSTKIKSITLTYDFTNITYMSDGGIIEKTSEALLKGLKINNTGRKNGLFFGGWMTEAGDKVTVVPEEDVVLYPIWLESLDMKPQMLSWGRLITKNDLERYPDATLVLNFAFNGSISGNNGAITADWDNSNSTLESWSRLDGEYEVTRKYKASYLIDFLNKRNKEHFETNMLTNAEGYEIKGLYFTYSEEPDVQLSISDKTFFIPRDSVLRFSASDDGLRIHVNCEGGIAHRNNTYCRISGCEWSNSSRDHVVTGYYLNRYYIGELPETLVLSEDIVIYPKFEEIYPVMINIHVDDEVLKFSYDSMRNYKFTRWGDNITLNVDEYRGKISDSMIASGNYTIYSDPECTEEIEFNKYYLSDPKNRVLNFYLSASNVIFDPATISYPNFYGNGEIVEVNGKKYVKMIVSGYDSLLHVSERDLSGYTSFKAEMFGAENDSSLRYLVKLMDSSYADISGLMTMEKISAEPQFCSAGIAEDEGYNQVSKSKIFECIQFIVQDNTEEHNPQSGYEVYLGKIIAECE